MQRRKPNRNLSVGKWNLIQFFRKNDNYIVVHADKNLGPCIIDRDYYIHKGCLEHLGNENNYKQLTKRGANNIMWNLRYKIGTFFGKYSEDLSPPEITFLNRALHKNPDKLARFRMTAKVHKTPWKMRPIVCCAGTFMNDWSKWLDHWLQQLKPHVPTFVKDSDQILNEVKPLELPTGALLFTADAVSMYNNIDTEHAIAVISWWLDDLHARGELPFAFPLEAVKSAMVTIMRNNVFEWGDLYFLQLLGTAMGTSSAVMWATLYFAYHEVHCLIPNHGDRLFYFKRFINDIFGVWTGTTTQWKTFCTDVNNFGILRWEIETPTTAVTFLDLSLSITGNKIVSKTFQKPENLFLYLPASSAHPQGCIKGTVYSLINRYYRHNTNRKDYIFYVAELYRHLLNRGWEIIYIRQLIMDATTKIEERGSRPRTPPTSKSDDESLYIHLEYHPDDISRQKLRQLYDKCCGELFLKELGIERPTIAYSRPKNIGDYVTQAKLHQAPGKSSSIIMGEYKQGLNPV